MNLHLLRVFAVVAETGNFSQAAERLYISQPAVSKGVQELERHLETALFDRSGHKIALTEAGQLLYSHAQQLFAIERAAETALTQLQGLDRGQLALGASHTTGTYLLPPLLGQFHRRYPGVQLSLEINNTHQIIEHLQHTPLDMVFVEGPVQAAHLVITPWRVDRLVVIATPDHPLAAKQPVRLAQLVAEPFIMRESGSGTREVVERQLLEHDFHIQVAMELGGNQAVKQAVIAGLGIAIVSEATVVLELKTGILTTIQVSDFPLSRTLTYVTVRGRPSSRALAAFQLLLFEAV